MKRHEKIYLITPSFNKTILFFQKNILLYTEVSLAFQPETLILYLFCILFHTYRKDTIVTGTRNPLTVCIIYPRIFLCKNPQGGLTCRNPPIRINKLSRLRTFTVSCIPPKVLYY